MVQLRQGAVGTWWFAAQSGGAAQHAHAMCDEEQARGPRWSCNPESSWLGNKEQRRPVGTCNGGGIGEVEKDRERAALDLGWERDDKWGRCVIKWIK